MTFNILEIGGLGRRDKLADAATFDEAEATVRDRFPIVHFERDTDHPGCADFYTRDGMLGVIEPAGFTLDGAAQ